MEELIKNLNDAIEEGNLKKVNSCLQTAESQNIQIHIEQISSSLVTAFTTQEEKVIEAVLQSDNITFENDILNELMIDSAANGYDKSLNVILNKNNFVIDALALDDSLRESAYYNRTNTFKIILKEYETNQDLSIESKSLNSCLVESSFHNNSEMIKDIISTFENDKDLKINSASLSTSLVQCCRHAKKTDVDLLLNTFDKNNNLELSQTSLHTALILSTKKLEIFRALTIYHINDICKKNPNFANTNKEFISRTKNAIMQSENIIDSLLPSGIEDFSFPSEIFKTIAKGEYVNFNPKIKQHNTNYPNANINNNYESSILVKKKQLLKNINNNTSKQNIESISKNKKHSTKETPTLPSELVNEISNFAVDNPLQILSQLQDRITSKMIEKKALSKDTPQDKINTRSKKISSSLNEKGASKQNKSKGISRQI